MGLLKALGLEAPLDAKMSAAANSIKSAESALKLDKTRKKQLDLEGSSKTVAENLTALDGKVEPKLLEAKKAVFESLSTRIAGRAANDPALETDAMELQMLAAETGVALKDNKKTRATLEESRKGFANALVTRFGAAGQLEVDLKAYIDVLVENGGGARLNAVLKGIDQLRGSEDAAVKLAASNIAVQVAKDAQARQKKMGASVADRDASRTPNDVVVHLMALVNTALKTNKTDAALAKVAKDGRTLFMTHMVDTDATKKLIADAKAALAGVKDPGAETCDTLLAQLPKQDSALTPAQQQDNLYGRVMDTKLIGGLVADPPPELLSAAGESGKSFAKLIADDGGNKNAANSLKKHYVIEDQRPWSKAVPAFDDIANAKDGDEALKAIKKFLSTPPTTGAEIIAVQYLMTKMSICMGQTGAQPDWMVSANANYGEIGKQALRDRAAPPAKNKDGSKGTSIMSEGAGITLLHQPTAVDDDTLIPSERPGTTNRFGNRTVKDNNFVDQTGELDEVKRSEAIKVQHDHALPFASGVSGSTNILLHLLKHQKDNGLVVDNSAALMNAMMFLVYDGGHSMHEVMWTANQTDNKLGLGFDLGDKDNPNEFVSDYDVLTDKCGGALKTAMQTKMDEAWAGTQEYLQENSFFAMN